MKSTEKPEELFRFVRENQSGRLLILERNLSFVPEDLRGRLRSVRKWSYSGHREYGLYTFGAAASEAK
jgi:hypothetical protein